MIIYVLSFLATIIIEFLIIYLITKFEWKELLKYVVLINLVTWPWAVIIYIFGANFYLVELSVILVESILLMLLLRKKYVYALLLSLVANVVTAAIGLLF